MFAGVGGGEMKATFFCTSEAPFVPVEGVLRELRPAPSEAAAAVVLVVVIDEPWAVSSD